MCGIFGILGKIESKEQIINQMSALLQHRGPDDKGIYQDEKACLGHRRLSIIDLEGGKEPMHNEDDSVWITFNGEIYNFQELREELLNKGHSFYTKCDVEVLVHLYEEEGINLVKRLNGMFAFALWDKKNGKLHLVRDTAGIKPLYYSYINNELFFASEIKALVQSGAVKPELNEESLEKFFFYRYIPDENTFFKDVYKLLPGEVLTFSDGKIETKNFRSVAENILITDSEEKSINQLRSRIKCAVKYEMIADVPIGTFLSGGIDSSAVTAIAEMNTDKRVDSYSVEFETNDPFIKSEIKYAKMLSEKFHVQNYHISIKEQEVINKLPLIAWHYDEPMGDAATIPTFFISALAKKNVKVVLSGEGGDEQFAGYKKYENMLKAINGSPTIEAENLARSYMKEIKIFMPEQMDKLFVNFDKKLFEQNTLKNLQAQFENATKENVLNKMLDFDQRTMLCENYLMKADKMTMAHGLEERVPLLNIKIREFSSLLNPKLKSRDSEEKYILKQALQGLLPEEIINRKKQGYGTPTKNWFENEIGKLFSQRIDTSLAFKKYFNIDYIRELYEQHRLGKENNNTKLWCLLAFDLWYEIYIVRKDQKPSQSYKEFFGQSN